MQTRTIPDDQWIEYFDRFSRDHIGCAVTIEVLDREAGPQHVALDLPLEGISFDTKGTRPSSIEISAGDRPDRHVSHVIDMPLNIREATEPNGDIDVQIEPARGPVTLLHVRGVAH
jgi:uncharacterized protein DUF5335